MNWIRDWVFEVIKPFLTRLKNRLANIKVIENENGTFTFYNAENTPSTIGKTIEEVANESATITRASTGYINPNPTLFKGELDYVNYITAKNGAEIVEDVVYNASHSLKVHGFGSTLIGDNFFPIDLNKEYRAVMVAKSLINGIIDEDKKVHHYLGVVCYDGDKKVIYPYSLTCRAGTRTVLTKDLVAGDTTLEVADASNFFADEDVPYTDGDGVERVHRKGHMRSVSFHKLRPDNTYGYIGENGRYYDELGMTQDWLANLWEKPEDIVQLDNGNWEITLKSPYDGSKGLVPAGTKVANCYSGGTYNYWISYKGFKIDGQWHEYKSNWREQKGSDETSIYWNVFRNGTSYCKLLALPNYYMGSEDPDRIDLANVTTWYSKLGLEWRSIRDEE